MPHKANQGSKRSPHDVPSPSWDFVRRQSPTGSVRSLQGHRHDSDNDLETEYTRVPLRKLKRNRREYKYVGMTTEEVMQGFRHKAGRLLSTCGSSTPSESSDTTHIDEEIHVSKDLKHVIKVTRYNSPREGTYAKINMQPLKGGAMIHHRQSRFLKDDHGTYTRKPKRRKAKSQAPDEASSSSKRKD